MPRRVPRRAALLALTTAVLLAHLLLLAWGLPSQWGEGAAQRPPRRLEVAFVRELAPAVPPQAPVVLRSLRRPRAVSAAVQGLGPAAGQVKALEPVERVEQAELDTLEKLGAALAAWPPSQGDPLPEAPSAAASDALPLSVAGLAATAASSAVSSPAALAASSATALAASAAASAATAFDWPPSTRLSYVLTGYYRGQVDGRAQVEWLRQGTRYQVHLDLGIGPPFANIVSRRISSEGEITPQGLFPQRYDEETRVAFRDPRRLRITLDAEQIHLPGGRSQARPAGVQDSASQFVQMTWMFTLQPALLQAGRELTLPLALPRRVEDWVYDVVGPVTLSTPVGELQTVHVKPRRQPQPGVDLTAELWFAPSLQYLPVRIVVRHDAQTHVDLLLDRLPQQAAEPGR